MGQYDFVLFLNFPEPTFLPQQQKHKDELNHDDCSKLMNMQIIMGYQGLRTLWSVITYVTSKTHHTFKFSLNDFFYIHPMTSKEVHHKGIFLRLIIQRSFIITIVQIQ